MPARDGGGVVLGGDTVQAPEPGRLAVFWPHAPRASDLPSLGLSFPCLKKGHHSSASQLCCEHRGTLQKALRTLPRPWGKCSGLKVILVIIKYSRPFGVVLMCRPRRLPGSGLFQPFRENPREGSSQATPQAPGQSSTQRPPPPYHLPASVSWGWRGSPWSVMAWGMEFISSVLAGPLLKDPLPKKGLHVDQFSFFETARVSEFFGKTGVPRRRGIRGGKPIGRIPLAPPSSSFINLILK